MYVNIYQICQTFNIHYYIHQIANIQIVVILVPDYTIMQNEIDEFEREKTQHMKTLDTKEEKIKEMKKETVIIEGGVGARCGVVTLSMFLTDTVYHEGVT